jgi:hypothetical protein
MSEWTDETVIEALQGDDPDVALEAAEAVAAAAGYPGDGLSAEGREWAETNGVPPEELVERALRRVRDLCSAETDDATLEGLRDLRFRLGDALAQ